MGEVCPMGEPGHGAATEGTGKRIAHGRGKDEEKRSRKQGNNGRQKTVNCMLHPRRNQKEKLVERKKRRNKRKRETN